MNWLHQIKFSDICIIIFGTIEHFLSYLFNYWFDLLAFFFEVPPPCRITVSSLGKVHNLYFFVCPAGLRTVLYTKKMLHKFRFLVLNPATCSGLVHSGTLNKSLTVPSLSSFLFAMTGLTSQGSSSCSPISPGHCSCALEPCQEDGTWGSSGPIPSTRCLGKLRLHQPRQWVGLRS